VKVLRTPDPSKNRPESTEPGTNCCPGEKSPSRWHSGFHRFWCPNYTAV